MKTRGTTSLVAVIAIILWLAGQNAHADPEQVGDTRPPFEQPLSTVEEALNNPAHFNPVTKQYEFSTPTPTSPARSASAVDGYKEFKFGMSVPEVRKLAKISLSHSDLGNGVVRYDSEAFPFGGKKVYVAFFFIDGKLLRIGLAIPFDSALAVLDSLKEKYGAPSTPPDRQAWDAVDTKPNIEVYVGFDIDTVIWKVASDESIQKRAMVLYTSPDYDRMLIEAEKKGVKDDL